MDESLFSYRRKERRIPCDVPAALRVDQESSSPVKCLDITNNGVGVLVNQPVAVNRHVLLEIEDSRRKALSLKGKITWCSKITGQWRLGIVFDRVLPFNCRDIEGTITAKNIYV